MIQAPYSPGFYSHSPMMFSARPPSRLDFRTTSSPRPAHGKSSLGLTGTNNAAQQTRSPALMRSWDAFDRLFEDAFAPSPPAPEATYPKKKKQHQLQQQQYYEPPTPSDAMTTGFTNMFENSVADETERGHSNDGRSERADEDDDDRTAMITRSPVPGSYPQRTLAQYPNPHLMPPPSAGADEPPSSADEDFQRLWEEANYQKQQRKQRTAQRTVTRRRILQRGNLSPGGTVSTNALLSPGSEQDPYKQLRKKKSQFHLYRNGDADVMTATFDLPHVRKEDVHVAFQVDRLTITWESVHITERRDEVDRAIIRERKERKYARTLPLPAGTGFEDVKAYLEDGRLSVTYPKYPRQYPKHNVLPRLTIA